MKDIVISNLTEILLKEISIEDTYRCVHNFGHLSMAKYFNQRWDKPLDSDLHDFNFKTVKDASSKNHKYEKDITAIMIYCAGYAAEGLFEFDADICRESTAIRFANDMKLMLPYIKNDLKQGSRQHQDSAQDLISKDSIMQAYTEHINIATLHLMNIAKANNMAPTQYLQNGAVKLWALMKKDSN